MKKICLFVYENRVSIEVQNGTSRTVAGTTIREVIVEMPEKDKELMLALGKEIVEHSQSQPVLKVVSKD